MAPVAAVLLLLVSVAIASPDFCHNLDCPKYTVKESYKVSHTHIDLRFPYICKEVWTLCLQFDILR